MRIDHRGMEFIKQWEGVRLTAYRCTAGVPTIGVGHTRGVQMGDRISMFQAERYLAEDVRQFEDAVNRLVRVRLTQNQFNALVSFTFNLGETNLANSTLLKRLNAGNYVGAAAQFGLWVRSGGRITQGLINRRAAEKAMFLA